MHTTILKENTNYDDVILTVRNTNVFPNPPFNVVIDREIITVISKTSTQLTVERGIQTVPTSHKIGAKVSLTVIDFDEEDEETEAILDIVHDTFDDRPTPGEQNRIFLGSNTHLASIDDVTKWDEMIYNRHIKGFRDSEHSFSWVNQGGAALLPETFGYTILQAPASVGSNMRARLISTPSTPYTFKMFLNFIRYNIDFLGAGFVLRDSGSGRLLHFGPVFTGNLTVRQYVAPNIGSTTFSFPIVGIRDMSSGIWLRLTDNGTNHIFDYSYDGFEWFNYGTTGRTVWLVNPNQIGYHIDAGNNLFNRLIVYSWEQV